MNFRVSSENVVIKDHMIDAFRTCLSSYLKENGTGNSGYDEYITIICEYQALVAERPLHPLKIRHFENEAPEDTDDRKYCCWKSQYINETDSLCRFCNCLPWPDKGNHKYEKN